MAPYGKGDSRKGRPCPGNREEQPKVENIRPAYLEQDRQNNGVERPENRQHHHGDDKHETQQRFGEQEAQARQCHTALVPIRDPATMARQADRADDGGKQRAAGRDQQGIFNAESRDCDAGDRWTEDQRSVFQQFINGRHPLDRHARNTGEFRHPCIVGDHARSIEKSTDHDQADQQDDIQLSGHHEQRNGCNAECAGKIGGNGNDTRTETVDNRPAEKSADHQRHHASRRCKPCPCGIACQGKHDPRQHDAGHGIAEKRQAAGKDDAIERNAAMRQTKSATTDFGNGVEIAICRRKAHRLGRAAV